MELRTGTCKKGSIDPVLEGMLNAMTYDSIGMKEESVQPVMFKPEHLRFESNFQCVEPYVRCAHGTVEFERLNANAHRIYSEYLVGNSISHNALILSRLCVVKDQRRRGIASQLLSFAVKCIDDIGATAIVNTFSFEREDTSLDILVRLYRDFGFYTLKHCATSALLIRSSKVGSHYER